MSHAEEMDALIKKVVQDPDMYITHTRLKERFSDHGASYRIRTRHLEKRKYSEKEKQARSFFGLNVRDVVTETLLDDNLSDRDKVYELMILMLRTME
jgi:hypothetical protein